MCLFSAFRHTLDTSWQNSLGCSSADGVLALASLGRDADEDEEAEEEDEDPDF